LLNSLSALLRSRSKPFCVAVLRLGFLATIVILPRRGSLEMRRIHPSGRMARP
jgi:hypothetical protein